MLKQLTIKNYALIEELELIPSRHLNTITGETGAGKSIMLGAISLLLGNRADTKVLLNQQEKCVVEGEFEISAYRLERVFQENDLDYEQSTIIRREINTSGKSRAFINDTPVTLDLLKSIGVHLVDIHSQHENLLLHKSDFQVQLLDAFAGTKDLLNEYNNAFNEYKSVAARHKDLTDNANKYKSELDYNTFLLNELVEAELKAPDDNEINEELKVLENSEEIQEKLSRVNELFNDLQFGTLSQLSEINAALIGLTKISDKYEQLAERVNSSLIELKDIEREVELEAQNVELDPSRLQFLQERLDLIYKLQLKHKVDSVEQLIEIRDELKLKVNEVLDLDHEIELLEKRLKASEETVLKIAGTISDKRLSVIPEIQDRIAQLLQELGMPQAVISIERTQIEPIANGIDHIEILFSANKGILPQPLKKVASGGEFSRLMFVIKYLLAQHTALPSIIFDEIDTGISGEIAIKMGKMMQLMSTNHQVIAITHLPQVAAKGNEQFFVFKEDNELRTISKMRKLSREERVSEIAQMIGGDQPSDSAIQSAKELLQAQ